MTESLCITKQVSCHVVVKSHVAIELPIPCFICDFGAELPSLLDLMMRFSRIDLLIKEEDEGTFTFIVSGDKTHSVSNEEAFMRTIEDLDSSKLFRGCVTGDASEFFAIHEVNEIDYYSFFSAREKIDGFWVLVVATSDAIEVLVDQSGKVVRQTKRQRSMYVV